MYYNNLIHEIQEAQLHLDQLDLVTSRGEKGFRKFDRIIIRYKSVFITISILMVINTDQKMYKRNFRSNNIFFLTQN